MEDDGLPEMESAATSPAGLGEVWLRAVSAMALAVISFGLAWAGVLPFAALVLVIVNTNS